MLLPDDQLLVQRDSALPGLAILLDPEALADRLQPHLPGRPIISASPTYVRYKPGTSCLVSFSLHTDGGCTDAYAIAYPAREAQKLRKETDGAVASAIGPGAMVFEECAVVVHVFPNDVRLDALRLIGDPPQRLELLKKLLPSHESLWHPAITRLAYKPHRRFVAMLSADNQPRAVLKLYTPGGFRIAARNARLIESRRRLRVPRRMGRSSRHSLVVYRWIDGQLLGDVASIDAASLHRVGESLHTIHEQDAPELPLLDQAAEAQRLCIVASATGALLPELQERLHMLAQRLIESYPRPRAIVTVHGDFHARQILITDRKVAILDLDEAARSSPAADLGNFIAHLHRHALSAGVADAAVAGAGEALCRGYRSACGHAVDDEIHWHTAAALLRLAPHPFRARESGWRHRTHALLERAEQIADHFRPSRPVSSTRSARVDDPFNCRSDQRLGPYVSRALDSSFMEPRFATTLAKGRRVRIERARVVRCKPQRRCIIEYELTLDDAVMPPRQLSLIGKVRAKGADEPTFRLLQKLREQGFDDHSSDGVSVPEPVALIEDAGMWLQRRVPGRPVTQRLREPGAQRLAARIAEAITKLHHANIEPVRRRRHSIDDELTILRNGLLDVAKSHPDWSSRLDSILGACAELAETIDRPAQPCGIHRDFYADHVLVEGQRLWLIDLDLYCQGDPALDIGNFIAHLTEQGLREHGDPRALEPTARVIEDRFVEVHDPSIRERVRVYETLTLARHITISHRLAERRHLTGELITLCERRLTRALTTVLPRTD